MAQHRFSLVACARWETAQIQEWVEYHKSIGFDHIYLYSNDDDPLPLFRAVAPYAFGASPFVTFRHWPHVGQQVEIYQHFLTHFKAETEWFSFLDIDEFFVLKPDNDVAAFMRDYEADADCLYFNWMVYGHSGKVRREDGDTLTSYLRRADKPDAHTKMICRSSAIDPAAIQPSLGYGAFWHFLDNYRIPGLRCLDVLHQSTQGYGASFPASARPFVQREGFAAGIIERGYIAHFQFRSEEDFLRRWQRGGFDNSEQWRAIYETGAHKSILETNNIVYDSYLAAYWYRHTARGMRFGVLPPFGSPGCENVALNKPSFQSSVYEPTGEEAPGSRVSGGGNNGVRTGTYGFHTQFQEHPWWVVDLLEPYRVAEIHIYNRTGPAAIAARASALDVMLSIDGDTWSVPQSRTDLEPFGLDGTPLVIRGTPDTLTRFVLLRLRGSNFLHLAEVEVYGRLV